MNSVRPVSFNVGATPVDPAGSQASEKMPYHLSVSESRACGLTHSPRSRNCFAVEGEPPLARRFGAVDWRAATCRTMASLRDRSAATMGPGRPETVRSRCTPKLRRLGVRKSARTVENRPDGSRNPDGAPGRWCSRKWCCERGLNSRPLPYQGSALPLSYRSAGTPKRPLASGSCCCRLPRSPATGVRNAADTATSPRAPQAAFRVSTGSPACMLGTMRAAAPRPVIPVDCRRERRLPTGTSRRRT